ALCAEQVAAACGHLYLCDGAPTVRERLAVRYSGHPNISIIAPEALAGLPPGSIDTIIVNSVIQYLSPADFSRLLGVARDKLSVAGQLVLGDVIPRHVNPVQDVSALLRFAAGNGFLLAAAAGLVRSAFSSYPRVRRTAGFLQLDEPEVLQALANAGLTGRREPSNIGHNPARMTFIAMVSGGQPPTDKGGGGRQNGSKPGPPGYTTSMLLFGAIWLALSSPWLSGAVTIPYDAKALFQAQLQFLANALHSGQSPLWNPSAFVGLPQIADPQSLILSPAFLLAYLEKAPSFAQLDAYVLVLLGLGGLAIMKLCQDRGWHPAGGIVAAIAFAFGASAAWRIQHIAQIQSLAFFAVTLWLLARALERSSLRFGALAGVAAGLMLIEPNQVALLGGYLLAGYCVSHWLTASNRGAALRASLPPLLCAAATCVALAALPVLLTWLFLDSSNRPEIAFSEAARGSLHPASLLTGVVADLFGAFDPKVDYWGPYSEWWSKTDLTLTQNMCQIYIGTLPIVLVLTVGLARGVLWRRELRFYAIASAALLLYALGRYTPAFALFFDVLPGVDVFRRPVDALFLLGATLSIAGGHLVHLWATARLPAATLRQKALEVGLILAILIAALATAWSMGRTAVAMKPLLLAMAWIGAATLLLATPGAWLRRGSGLVIAAPALLLATDLAANNGPNESTALPASSYEVLKLDCRNDTIRFLKANMRRDVGTPWRDRVELVGLGFEWQNAALVHGLEGTLGYNPFRLSGVANATGAEDYIAGADQKNFSRLFPSYSSPMADLLGLRYLAIGVPVEQIDHRLKPGDLRLVARTKDAYIYENPRALPRALFVTDWRLADFDGLIASGDWPQVDLRRTVLLDSAPKLDTSASKGAAALPRSSSVAIRHYENTKVVLEVEAAQAGLVVLHDVWHPWWSVEVDGIETPILRANILFRAVPVRAGHHVLTFEFNPISSAIDEIGERLGQHLTHRRNPERPRRRS
ncbi:MAG TPA: hypothetical protein VFY92_05520, partial [Hyphomicrobiaceae bacterium]|nr:hypothetical protein [Hyphomicrobiaceae bacterium]